MEPSRVALIVPRETRQSEGTSPAAARLSREATVDTYWLAASQEGGAGRRHLDCLAAPALGGPDWLEAQRRPVS